MAFQVYPVLPTPQAAPLSVLNSDTEEPAIGQLTGPSPFPSDNKAMFIRIAASPPPAVPTGPVNYYLRAGTGDAVLASVGVSRTVFRQPGTDFADYVGDVLLFSEADNVSRIQFGFFADTAETWELHIENLSGVTREFTWVVAGTEAETAQPWIVVDAERRFTALIDTTAQDSVIVRNKGTGTLNVTSFSPALPAELTLTTPLPLVVPPSGSQALTFEFAAPGAPPAPDGVIDATLTLAASPADTTAGTSAGHNQQVLLAATTQRLDVVLLLDASGSMSWDPTGTQLPPGDADSRWSELSDGAGEFLNLLAHFGHERGRLGIARFPAGPSADLFPMAPIPDLAGMAGPKGVINGVLPSGGTPMGDGLDHVVGPGNAYLTSDALSVAADRRWLLLMSDGAHNSGSHHPLEFVEVEDGGTAPANQSLEDMRVELFAVAYGIDGFSDVDHVLLKTLADGSIDSDNSDPDPSDIGGQIRKVDEEGITPLALAQALRDGIKSGLTGTTSPLDPRGVFQLGGPEVRHQATITPYDGKAAFVLSWNTRDAGRLQLSLLTPNCELITPDNAGQGRFRQVAFQGGNRSNTYLIDEDFIRGIAPDSDVVVKGSSPIRPRYGAWTFIISEPPIIGIDSEDVKEVEGQAEVRGGPILEQYAYDVIVDSSLKMELNQAPAPAFAGDQLTLTARLTAGGRPVSHASVTVSTTTPAQSFDNWLAALVVPEEALKRAEEILADQDASPLLVKQLGAKLAGLTFDQGERKVTIGMVEEPGTGVYRATFAETSVPERYTFFFRAVGDTEDGVSFRRDGKLETFVQVRPEAEFTTLDIQPVVPGQTNVTVIPRDRFGNVLLIDPNASPGFDITVKDGEFDGPLVSNLDGSYRRTIRFDPRHNPAIGVKFRNQDVIVPTPPAPVGDLKYVDRVFRFCPGVLEDANQHANPREALGSVVDKPADRFVALGAGGSLDVGFRDQVFVACGDDDVTVFVRPVGDPRAYRVEAYSVERRRWITLGESPGATQSFSLRRCGIRHALAIRVVDISGRAKGANGVPLSDPGVNIRGIGALKTKHLFLPHDRLPDWIR